ncbi:enoyl-CoA hydratase-related protein [Pseudohoeflea coraliihabitans]|uniref:Enoyl-CoA hydratase/isomerase family protein n=1 Tax=Pseudohoeflea coraliihabitans TaxID=2860393 RepID=A0ABS6WQG8_9HYPH|nr:enoyl-CoA hydratase-related protein [Pseudohoeflea sp. DP4N28-3]MBW3098203.1 enoyl-CoA hydratase/isomerase family protein [Pseudohoeflea sp. DP4N28-3]
MHASEKLAEGGLDLAVEEGIGRLRLDRPHRKNAVNQAMWQAIPAALALLSGDMQARIIVLSGAGGSDFSAGADITEFDTVRRDATTARAYERANSEAFAALRTASVPVIASLRGVCFGGAFGLAAACDLRIGDTSCRFAVPAARLGLAYPADAVVDMVTALGAQRARHLLLTGDEMDAETALAAGFLLTRTTPDALEAETVHLAQRIASAAPLSIAAARATVAAALSGDQERMHAARELGDTTFESADYAEGRAAFRDRRRPVFTGR